MSRNRLAGANGVTISTITPLTDWIAITQPYETLVFQATPHGLGDVVEILVETSDGAQPDTDYWTKQGDAGKQASARIGPPVSGGKYRLSATSIGAGGTFPPIQVDWSIFAVPK